MSLEILLTISPLNLTLFVLGVLNVLCAVIPMPVFFSPRGRPPTFIYVHSIPIIIQTMGVFAHVRVSYLNIDGLVLLLTVR